MPVTIKEFSEKVGLTPCTISRAFNGDSRVRPSTKKRIVTMAKELGYRPSPIARSLSKGRHEAAGIVIAAPVSGSAVEDLRDYVGVLAALAQELEDKECNLLMGSAVQKFVAGNDEGQLPRIVDQLHVNRLIVLSHMWQELADEIRLLKMPTVVIDGPSCGLPTVQRDEEDAVEQLVDHLVQLGHKRIAFTNHENRIGPIGYRDTLWPIGYLRAITRHRLVPMPGWDQFESPQVAIERLTQLDEPPTAIITYDDVQAIHFIHHLTTRGLRVPDDISVVAMLDRGYGGIQPVPVTRIASPETLIAKRAAKLLLDQDTATNQSGEVVKLSGKLIPGGTTCRLAPK